uniref:Uncharacterized protein n=1 Tax=Leersia perrieri TaxID=77586 RepID=A0A0D9X711_9ORYZ
MATAKGLSSSVPPQGGSSGTSKRQAHSNEDGTKLHGSKCLATSPPRNNQQPYNGQSAHSLTYRVKTLAEKE